MSCIVIGRQRIFNCWLFTLNIIRDTFRKFSIIQRKFVQLLQILDLTVTFQIFCFILYFEFTHLSLPLSFWMIIYEILFSIQKIVEAIMEIKELYRVAKHWQGDPCVPSEFSWDGLNCSNNNPPRIISL